MSSRPMVMVVILVWGVGGLSSARTWAQADAPPASTSPVVTVTPEEYEHLVQELGAPRLASRDAATERLCRLEASHLPQLARSYREAGEFEVKRRLRYVVEHIFHRDQLAGQDGFLGVEIEMTALRVGYDPATRKHELGIGVKRAMDGFAAHRAGMENGDIIIGFNGRPIPDDRSSASFVKLVSSHAPGDRVDLTVLRLEEPRTIIARAGERPAAMLDGAVMEPCTLSPRTEGAPIRIAVRVLHVEPGSPASALGLPHRSCILAVNNQSPNTNHNAENFLQSAVNEAGPNTELAFTVAEGREVTLEVTLGKRPVTMISEREVLQEARNRFMAFWKEQGQEHMQLRHRRMESLRLDHLRSPDLLLPEVGVLP